MSSQVPVPYFPTPPADYNRNYMNQVIRAFAVFAQQVNNPGPLRATTLTLNPTGSRIDAGELSYNTAEDTFDLTHLHGVVQQIGFETYMRVTNDTGSTIANGTVVGFAGVNGEIKVSPYIADGTVPELYFVGVTTFDMLDGESGPVTIYGKVRGMNTTGASVSQTWAVGDILYASAATAGRFTKVRPTAPNAVIAVAAVLSVSATDGVIMVRPTIPLGLDYGSFTDLTDQTLAATNTPTPIKLNTTEISNGVTIVNDGSGNPTRITVAQAGFYQIAVSNQYTSSNSSSKDVQTWLRINGTDVADSNSYVTLNGNGVNVVFSTTYSLSLLAGDYVQVMWASNDTAVSVNYIAATGYSPACPSTIVSVTQIQL
jgi:hypothetical protein